MGPGMFDGLDKLMRSLLIWATIGGVLAGYELMRLLWWAWHHLKISVE